MKMASCSSGPGFLKMSDFRDIQILQVRRTWGQLLALVNLSNEVQPTIVVISSLKDI